MKKHFSAFTRAAAWLSCLALVCGLAGPVRAAGPFTVTTVNDTHAVSAGTSPADVNGNISLRSAIEAANAQAGATTINIPPGLYNLALGELDVATNVGKNITIQASGGNAVNTIISQTNGTDRVFNIDTNSIGNDIVTISGLTIRGGHDQRDIAGGAGILAGSITATPKDVLNLSNCVVANNHCTAPNTNYTAQIGGGLQMAGGDLNITSCTFSNNSSSASQGGAIAFFVQSVASSLNISNSIFANNSMTNTSGSGPDGGGAIFVGSTSNSVHTVLNTVFSGNQAIGTSGNTYGGAIEFNTGTLNITNSTFTGNQAASTPGSGGLGGAIYMDSGTNNTSFCRIVANISSNGGDGIYNHNTNGAYTMAVNDWWGCNGGPGASGCDVAATDIGGLTDSPYIILTNTANPVSISSAQSTTLTASFLQNSAGTILTPSQISVLVGLPVTWNNAMLGTLSSIQTAIQANGKATATYTAGNTNGTGSANAIVDNGVATALIDITCPVITGVVSGGGSICPGNPTLVTVTVTGGVPPYSITLNNGATQAGSGPFNFIVVPSSSTNYQISSGQDADGCPVAGNGSAIVTVINSTASITPSPASVLANSGGNQASAPPGYASYAWTIINGFIVGPANLPTVSYVAGVSGTVTLGLTTTTTCGSGTTNFFVPIMEGLSIHTNLTFTNSNIATTTGITYDGTNYWDCSGGSTSGARLGSYTSSGTFIASYSPGLDFRSIFTTANGTVLARQFNSPIIYQQTNPGVFVNSGISLTGGTLNSQSSVVLNGAGTEYDAMSGGVVSRWSTNGTYLGSVNLQGFGSVNGENISPQNRGLAAFGSYWLTYNGGGVLSAWDYSGNRVFQTALPGAGTSLDSDYSFSCCNGKVFIVDVAGGLWRSFDIFSGASVAVLAAEETTAWTADVTNKIFGAGGFQKVDLIPVYTGQPLPTPAQLQAYKSVLVFSDYNFSDQVGLGNELADYIDQGGGVVLNTFAFDTLLSDGFSIQGRLTNGYMAFTTASYSAPAGATLVPVLPADPLLNGVTSFNGGSESFQNSSISIAPGATLVANWSNGQPLVGDKIDGAGRFVGLNFFPPSSDAFSPGWVSSTSGARLMANALLWAAQQPTVSVPAITSAPADQTVPLGHTVTFNVVATGAAPLSYQWRFNGTNIAGATANILSFTAQATNVGQYSVVVSNPNGQTCSASASLNTPLRFLSPILPGGNKLSLLLIDSDGSPVASNRAFRVQIYTTTNVALPFSQWIPLTNQVISAAGQLQVNGLPTTNPVSRFFRAAEIP